MRTRLIVLSVALATLTAPAAQAAGPMGFMPICNFGKNTQCAIQFVQGDRNVARIDQVSSRKRSVQFAAALQTGNSNRSYIGQIGGNQLAITVQSGSNNASYTYQEGLNQVSATVQTGNGNWGGTSSIGSNTATAIIQSN